LDQKEIKEKLGVQGAIGYWRKGDQGIQGVIGETGASWRPCV
jgi:hypothetical protein